MKQKLNYQRAAYILISLMNQHNKHPNPFLLCQIEGYIAALQDLGFEIVAHISESKYQTILIHHNTYYLYYTFQ